jgi:hypothetical protein
MHLVFLWAQLTARTRKLMKYSNCAVRLSKVSTKAQTLRHYLTRNQMEATGKKQATKLVNTLAHRWSAIEDVVHCILINFDNLADNHDEQEKEFPLAPHCELLVKLLSLIHLCRIASKVLTD